MKIITSLISLGTRRGFARPICAVSLLFEGGIFGGNKMTVETLRMLLGKYPDKFNVVVRVNMSSGMIIGKIMRLSYNRPATSVVDIEIDVKLEAIK